MSRERKREGALYLCNQRQRGEEGKASGKEDEREGETRTD
uniref:Uncharacterized protein n=1 Tax=Anguilla anguilla TaxID=7936 RepID=A0A0E9XHG0_ANGAN